ncbi:MAG: lactonase family protein [Clostridiaceae bacterium]|nr:lactonase family protein [Clostridiaceae bacterium]
MHKDLVIYVGTYTQPIKFGTGQILNGKGKGIYRLKLNLDTGVLVEDGMVEEAVNPSYLAIDQTKNFLYAVNELKEYEGKESGSVSSYKINPETYELTYLNTRPTGGTDPCHVTVNNSNTHVFVSNFMSGSVCVFPIEKDGSLGEATHFIQHTGSSIHKVRQTSPHAHSLTFDNENLRAFVPDLGIDKIMIYETDFTNGKLITNEIPWYDVKPGSGPRHCEFKGNYCYVINEISSTISVLSYNPANGLLTQIQEVPTVTVPFEGENTCADIHITPDGKYLYGSNRGHDSIVIYSIDENTGLLENVDISPCGGKTPRNFGIDPTGKYVLVCNQDTDNIVVFSIDQKSGKLLKVSDYSVPTPVCVKFY